MNKYEVGYPDEFIGVYYDTSEKGAMRQCQQDINSNNFMPETPVRVRLLGMVAIKVD